ncbi:MAG: DnaJ domain-containing protein [Hyphomicrobiaceae bacterium]
MQALLLGFAVLLIVLFFLHSIAGANSGKLARHIRWGVGTIILAIGVALLVRGAVAYGLPLITFAIWLFFGHSGGVRSAGRTAAQTSSVRTDHLEMELDLESGAMTGRVLKGLFAGREIETLAPAELALIWQDCRFDDPQSAQLIEAYLDRVHPTWREDMAKAQAEVGPGGIMTTDEAYEILGLKHGASEDEIRQAHRELMKKLHPDRGGSSYLAMKINEAKDLLLGE